MLCLKKGPNQPGPILSTLSIYFVHIFLLNNNSLRDPICIRPRIFLFSRPHFATAIRNPHSRPTFTTHVSRLTFATHIRDSASRPTFATPFLRLPFATPLATRVRDSPRDSPRDSRSRLPIAPTTATRYFLSRLPSCDSTTDGWTV